MYLYPCILYLVSLYLVSLYLASLYLVSVYLVSLYLLSVYLVSLHLVYLYLVSIYQVSLYLSLYNVSECPSQFIQSLKYFHFLLIPALLFMIQGGTKNNFSLVFTDFFFQSPFCFLYLVKKKFFLYIYKEDIFF